MKIMIQIYINSKKIKLNIKMKKYQKTKNINNNKICINNNKKKNFHQDSNNNKNLLQ